ncbi:hypothetical protein PCE1_001039 [Barthelona sp. PCE]
MFAQPQILHLDDVNVVLPSIRVLDGIHIGGLASSQRADFIFANCITHIINCCSDDVPNNFAQFGIQYLSFSWNREVATDLFEEKTVLKIVEFIDSAIRGSGTVLIHSVEGHGRCIACLVAYMGATLNWCGADCLKYISYHVPPRLKPNYLQHIMAYNRNIDTVLIPNVNEDQLSSKAIVLYNTLHNSTNGFRIPAPSVLMYPRPPPQVKQTGKVYFRQKSISWADSKREGNLIRSGGAGYSLDGIASIKGRPNKSGPILVVVERPSTAPPTIARPSVTAAISEREPRIESSSGFGSKSTDFRRIRTTPSLPQISNKPTLPHLAKEPPVRARQNRRKRPGSAPLPSSGVAVRKQHQRQKVSVKKIGESQSKSRYRNSTSRLFQPTASSKAKQSTGLTGSMKLSESKRVHRRKARNNISQARATLKQIVLEWDL